MKLFSFCLILLLSLVSCANVSQSVDATSEYWSKQDFCIGRYKLRLTAHVDEQMSDWFYNENRLNVTKEDDLKAILTYISNVKKDGGVDYNELFVSDKIIQPGQSLYYVTKYGGSDWDMDLVREFGTPFFVTLYNQIDQYLYTFYHSFVIPYKGQADYQKVNSVAKPLITQSEKYIEHQFLSKFEIRNVNVIPSQQGVCVAGGFIKDDGRKKLTGNDTITFKDFESLVMTVYMGYPQLGNRIPLLQRNVLVSGSEFLNTVDTSQRRVLRKGKKNINGLSGVEILLELGSDNYYFLWESDNKELQIEMTQKKGRMKLLKHQILDAWDTITLSFKPHH